jgi:AraC-like DNA-binding protein
MVELETDWVTAPPAPGLARIVEGYVGYRMTGTPPGVHRGLPSRHLTFIVSIGPDIDVIAQSDPRQDPARYRCVLSGLAASSALIAYGDRQEGVAIELTPFGSRALFSRPARELWNTSLELADVAGPIGDELWERLQTVTSWSERFAVCDEVLGRLAHPAAPLPELDHAWRAIVGSGGEIAVADLASRVGWSRQHLTRRFVDEYGLAPKLAARVVRFERARRMLESTPSYVSIAQVAASCGYYDQAHLDRDFAELAGCSPTQWLHDEVPSFQDAAPVDASSWEP